MWLDFHAKAQTLNGHRSLHSRRLLKGKAIHFFSGSKNWGHVISKISGRGRLDPKKSNENFAVPNERYLINIDNVMGRIIPPGKTEDSFNLLKGKKNVILIADLK